MKVSQRALFLPCFAFRKPKVFSSRDNHNMNRQSTLRAFFFIGSNRKGHISTEHSELAPIFVCINSSIAGNKIGNKTQRHEREGRIDGWTPKAVFRRNDLQRANVAEIKHKHATAPETVGRTT
jgi:hypothetical protein